MVVRSLASRLRNFVVDVVSGIGSLDDPGSRFSFSTAPENYTEAEIISAYTLSGQVQRAIEHIPQLAANFVYKDENNNVTSLDPSLNDEIERLRIRHLFTLASIAARLFKESYIIILTDQDDYSQPLNESEQILELMQLEIDQITFDSLSNQTRQYKLRINPTNSSTYQQYIETPIHESRVLPFVGKYLPTKIKAAYRGYNGSVVGGIMTSYGTYRHSLNISVSLLSRMATFIFKMAGLQDYLATRDAQGLSARLKILKQFIGSTGGYLVDAESEDVSWLTFPLQGIDSIVEQHKKQFTAETDLTHDQLWNEGSNDTASALEEVNINKRVESFLAMYWQDNFNKILNHLSQSQIRVKLGMVGTTSDRVQDQSQSSSNTNQTPET